MSTLNWKDVPPTVVALVQKHAGAAVCRHDRQPGHSFTLVDDQFGEITVKCAAGAFEPVAKTLDWPGKLVGGPNALTRTLTGSALGALLGYGAGWTAERLFPEKYVERGKASKRLGLLGAALGGAGAGYIFGRPATAQDGMAGWLKKSVDAAYLEESRKLASAGSAFLPTIPVDSWNRVVWNRQELPPQVKAMSTGLVSAAGAAHGGAKLVSPFDVGRIAVGMGSGAVSGMLVGKTLGALAGLTPPAQDAIFRSGVGAGLLINIMPMLSR